MSYLFLRNPDGSVTSIASKDPLPKAPPEEPTQCQNLLSCGRCRTVLSYESRAALVQCPVCTAFNNVSRLELMRERTLQPPPMRVPPPAPFQQHQRRIHTMCHCCRVTNSVEYGARYVRCGNCNSVNDISSAYQ